MRSPGRTGLEVTRLPVMTTSRRSRPRPWEERRLSVVGVAVVGKLDRRHDGADRTGDALARERRVGGREVLGDLHADLELNDEVDVARGAHGGHVRERGA